MKIELLRAGLKGVASYKDVLDTPVMACAKRLLDKLAGNANDGEGALEAYTDLFYTLRSEGYASLGQWLGEQLRYSESPYPLLAEKNGKDEVLEKAARTDVETFAELAALNCEECVRRMTELLGEGGYYEKVLENLPRWEPVPPFTFDSLTREYTEHGAGLFARYRAFTWEDKTLIPVADPDCPSEDEMTGYEMQRDEVIANTRALLEGKNANNVLLYGDSGTGKSATVKSLLAVRGFGDLRLIEVDKEELEDLSILIRSLAGKRQKFILFIDDLAFDQDDATYGVLKTILEGTLEKMPSNIAIYATSNRRHLVRQTFSDRAGDEVDASETIREKTSLSDRFGLKVAYLPLTRAEFLAMVERMARHKGIEMESEQLKAEAVKWEAFHHGRTPRTAKQFLASLNT